MLEVESPRGSRFEVDFAQIRPGQYAASTNGWLYALPGFAPGVGVLLIALYAVTTRHPRDSWNSTFASATAMGVLALLSFAYGYTASRCHVSIELNETTGVITFTRKSAFSRRSVSTKVHEASLHPCIIRFGRAQSRGLVLLAPSVRGVLLASFALKLGDAPMADYIRRLPRAIQAIFCPDEAMNVQVASFPLSPLSAGERRVSVESSAGRTNQAQK